MNLVALCMLSVYLAAPGDLGRLTSVQQEMFQRIATQEFCGCDSALTLAGCLEKRPNCSLASHLGDVLVRGIQMGAPQSALEAFMSQEVLGPYCAPPIKVEVEGAPRRGKAKGAVINVLEFADFRCSHCREAAPSVHKAIDNYANKVQFTYVPISLVENEMGTTAAEAALAANAQGKFWEMHTALFSREEGDFTPEVVRDFAKKVGLNLKQFDKDMAAHKYRDTLTKWHKIAMDAGVNGTPAFFINGRHFSFTPQVFSLEDRFDMELERNQAECK